MNAPISNNNNSTNSTSSNLVQSSSLVPNRSMNREPTKLNYRIPIPNSNVANLAYSVYGIINTLNQQNNTSPIARRFQELQNQSQAVQAQIALNATLYKEVRGIFDSMKNLAKQLLGGGQEKKEQEQPQR
jgi:hypothetical protein